mmetsp:Transcript_17466/g.51879  ORF Transcript_17466/g.51879 Transcript_17466/m.51879 type:complete len:357 (-) Transcript_17466:130-1200(-)
MAMKQLRRDNTGAGPRRCRSPPIVRTVVEGERRSPGSSSWRSSIRELPSLSQAGTGSRTMAPRGWRQRRKALWSGEAGCGGRFVRVVSRLLGGPGAVPRDERRAGRRSRRVCGFRRVLLLASAAPGTAARQLPQPAGRPRDAPLRQLGRAVRVHARAARTGPVRADGAGQPRAPLPLARVREASAAALGRPRFPRRVRCATRQRRRDCRRMGGRGGEVGGGSVPSPRAAPPPPPRGRRIASLGGRAAAARAAATAARVRAGRAAQSNASWHRAAGLHRLPPLASPRRRRGRARVRARRRYRGARGGAAQRHRLRDRARRPKGGGRPRAASRRPARRPRAARPVVRPLQPPPRVPRS